MREIKFRALPEIHKEAPENFPEYKEWLYSNGYYFDGINYWFMLQGKYKCVADAKYKIIDFNTLSQYTGLKDKNSKEIYEGDILHLPTYSDWLVIWYESGFYLQIINGLGSGDKYSLTQSACSTRKIIGNIYENNELLNG